jgi:hypothetical protein
MEALGPGLVAGWWGTAVLGAEQAVLPALGVAKPTPYCGIKAVGTDTLHHPVYAGVSGLAYDCL